VEACSMRQSIAVAIPMQTVIARTLARDTKCTVCHLSFSKKPHATAQAFRTAAKAAPANERAEKDNEESSDSPNCA